MTNTEPSFNARDLRDLYLEFARKGERVNVNDLLGAVMGRITCASFDRALDELAEREGVVVERFSVLRTWLTIKV